MRSARLVRPLGVARRIELVGEQPPRIDRIGRQPQRATQRRDRLGPPAGFAVCDRQFDVGRRGALLFTGKGHQRVERRLRESGTAPRRAQNEARVRMPGSSFQDLVRLFDGEAGIPLQQSRGVSESNLERPDGLRNEVQLNIHSIPDLLCAY